MFYMVFVIKSYCKFLKYIFNQNELYGIEIERIVAARNLRVHIYIDVLRPLLGVKQFPI